MLFVEMLWINVWWFLNEHCVSEDQASALGTEAVILSEFGKTRDLIKNKLKWFKSDLFHL